MLYAGVFTCEWGVVLVGGDLSVVALSFLVIVIYKCLFAPTNLMELLMHYLGRMCRV